MVIREFAASYTAVCPVLPGGVLPAVATDVHWLLPDVVRDQRSLKSGAPDPPKTSIWLVAASIIAECAARAGGGPPAGARCVHVWPVGARIVNAAAVDAPPPGFATVILTVAAEAICAVETVAVNCDALTNVVVSAEPFHCTVDPDTNPVPFTVSVNAGPPAVAENGLRLVMVGAA